MLYAWLPQPWKGGIRGISVEVAESLLNNDFMRTRLVIGEEKGPPSAWYWYRRKNPRAEGPTGPQHRMLKEIVYLAREHGLSTYDASYLDIAMRLELPLATQAHPSQRSRKKET